MEYLINSQKEYLNLLNPFIVLMSLQLPYITNNKILLPYSRSPLNPKIPKLQYNPPTTHTNLIIIKNNLIIPLWINLITNKRN